MTKLTQNQLDKLRFYSEYPFFLDKIQLSEYNELLEKVEALHIQVSADFDSKSINIQDEVLKHNLKHFWVYYTHRKMKGIKLESIEQSILDFIDVFVKHPNLDNNWLDINGTPIGYLQNQKNPKDYRFAIQNKKECIITCVQLNPDYYSFCTPYKYFDKKHIAEYIFR
jgi:hypothetical protein